MRPPLHILLLLVFSITINLSIADAKTLVLDGTMSARIKLIQRINFEVTEKKEKLSYRFALPSSSDSRSVKQNVENLDLEYNPKPASVRNETDRFGNRFILVEWRELSTNARVTIKYEAEIKSVLSAMQSRIPFPLIKIPESERIYLEETKQVQSSDKKIKELAGILTNGASTEYSAVTAIMNHVANNVSYAYNPSQYDALYTVKSGSGNCQNYAHLSLALLRAAGIPARIVGGIGLKDAWKVPVSKTESVVQSMGQGGHAWIEIYFPDLGWLAYDPQQSMQFTSTRHVKQTHGLDSKDINDTWRGTPPLPQYSEAIEANFIDDNIKVSLASQQPDPRGYLVSNRFSALVEAPVKPPPDVTSKPIKPVIPVEPVIPVIPVKPPIEVKPAKPVKPAKKQSVVIGNTSFPSMVELFQTVGDTATRILDKETAEYATSRYVYAQAFVVKSPLKVTAVSLAMKKFGGDGTIYIDLVADDNGKPGLSGSRSMPIYLERIPRKPGYDWVDFSLSDDPALLQQGKYWIVLRHSGEAIMNWFYTPGKRYGGSEDTRSTALGWKWEDIQTYDFVFKVSGMEI